MKTIQEQIEVMQHYANGGEVQCRTNYEGDYEDFEKGVGPSWNWQNYDYRIKEQKKTISIEKWLCKDNNLETFVILEATNIDTLLFHYYDNISKIKLLETCEVEL